MTDMDDSVNVFGEPLQACGEDPLTGPTVNSVATLFVSQKNPPSPSVSSTTTPLGSVKKAVPRFMDSI
jgi:hypothetical protein